jgi:trehalose 6-phosphate phosphatase
MPTESDKQLARFFNLLASSSNRALMLDYDGTLAPFVKDRDHAIPYPGVVEILSEIQQADHTRLVLVSGRSVADLTRLMGLDPPLEMFGSHGWEYCRADGIYTPPKVSQQVRAIINAAISWAHESGFREHCEPKPAGLGLHWRGIPVAEANRLREQFAIWWQTEASGESQQACAAIGLHEFDGGIELRAHGRDKGDAARAVLTDSPEGTLAAFLGDDATDEDAFSVIADPSLPVLVRPEHRETAARAWIRPPGELRSFLARWHECATIALNCQGNGTH